MSVTFTREEIEAKIAEFDGQIAGLNTQKEFWVKLLQMTPESVE